jgi:hypothetical protein
LSGKEVLGSDDDMFCVASPSDDSSTASVHSVSLALALAYNHRSNPHDAVHPDSPFPPPSFSLAFRSKERAPAAFGLLFSRLALLDTHRLSVPSLPNPTPFPMFVVSGVDASFLLSRVWNLPCTQGNSSPGPSESISHLGIDDSSSGGTPSSTSSAPPPQLPPQLNLSPQMEHRLNEPFSRQQQGTYPPPHHHHEAFLQGVYQGGFQQQPGSQQQQQQQQAYWSSGGGGVGAGGGDSSEERMMMMAQENQSLRNIISNLTQVLVHLNTPLPALPSD